MRVWFCHKFCSDKKKKKKKSDLGPHSKLLIPDQWKNAYISPNPDPVDRIRTSLFKMKFLKTIP